MLLPMESRRLVGSVYGREPFEVVASVEVFDRAQRIKRALKLSLPLFLIGLPLIPIPGVHLALLFLWPAAVFFAARRLLEVERVAKLAGACPCSVEPVDYDLPDRLGLPLTLRCPGCAEFVKIDAA